MGEWEEGGGEGEDRQCFPEILLRNGGKTTPSVSQGFFGFLLLVVFFFTKLPFLGLEWSLPARCLKLRGSLGMLNVLLPHRSLEHPTPSLLRGHCPPPLPTHSLSSLPSVVEQSVLLYKIPGLVGPQRGQLVQRKELWLRGQEAPAPAPFSLQDPGQVPLPPLPHL